MISSAAILSPPTSMHSQFEEVCQPWNASGAICFAARHSPKVIQIDCIRPLRSQVRVYEPEVGDLILGIVVDVLGHVFIKLLNGLGVSLVPCPTQFWRSEERRVGKECRCGGARFH